jgi:hypothetical protein
VRRSRAACGICRGSDISAGRTGTGRPAPARDRRKNTPCRKLRPWSQSRRGALPLCRWRGARPIDRHSDEKFAHETAQPGKIAITCGGETVHGDNLYRVIPADKSKVCCMRARQAHGQRPSR